MKPPCRAAILLPTGLEGTGGFGLVAGAVPWSEPRDFAEEFDGTVVSGTFSDDSRLIGFEGRAGIWGFALAGTGGDVAST
jgi:hypothetical protein